MEKKKIGESLAGAWQKVADAAKLAKLTVQDMTADAKQSRGKKAQQKADAQKVPASKDEPTAVEPPENAAPEIPCIATRNALQIIYYLMAADGAVSHSEEETFDAIGAELDPNFSASKPAIIKNCQAKLEKSSTRRTITMFCRTALRTPSSPRTWRQIRLLRQSCWCGIC